MILSFALSWFLNRFTFVVEFLYPTSLGRWLHITAVKYMTSRHLPEDRTKKFHSRTLETRFQITNRVFIHPLPQFLDNLGYLVVCLPVGASNEADERKEDTPLGTISVEHVPQVGDPILAFVIDCGDAEAVLELVDIISEIHYNRKAIEIHSILSTHKHHDHTAGNSALKAAMPTIKTICGGAVEKVPGCNYPLANGDMVPLPKSGMNDMNEEIQVEAIATPGHTRGSLVFCLRSDKSVALFTGDTMFSGGSGVPFESDIERDQEEKMKSMSPWSFIKANASNFAVERCFAELLARSVRRGDMGNISSDRVLVLAGHEYTTELLGRQLSQSTESCRWRNMNPSVFFETVSQLYVAWHRRSLPSSTGKLLVCPSTLRKELSINPMFRSLHKRGETVVRAILFWHRHFAKVKVPERYTSDLFDFHKNDALHWNKLSSTDNQWNVDTADVDRPIFATVYASELATIIDDLKEGKVSGKTAARKLEGLQSMLDIPTIGRRPIPDTLPSDNAICKGLVGLVLLGSSPAAMTLSDSAVMKMPAPVVTSSDRIKISKKRLLTVLYWLGLLDDEVDGARLVGMIHQLWKETKAHCDAMSRFDLVLTESNEKVEARKAEYDDFLHSNDVENNANNEDDIELGALKWILYGIPERRSSWFSKWCMPCSPPPPEQHHPIDKTSMRQHSGELVRHDPYSCLLCISGAGGSVNDDKPAQDPSSTGLGVRRAPIRREASVPDDQESAAIEISPEGLSCLIREA